MAPHEPETLFLRYRDAGDVGALARVFDLVAPELLRLARRLVPGADRAEDLVQETFLVALEKGEQFDRGERLEPWLVGILVNRARSARRRERRALEPERLREREVERPEAELDRDERRAAVSSAVRELPEPMRAVVEAKLAGRDAGETARELGISRGAVRVRLHRALARLRAVLPPSLATPFALLFMHTTGLGAARGRVLRTAREHVTGSGATASGLGLFPALAIGWTWMTKQALAAIGLALVGLTWMGVHSWAGPELAPLAEGERGGAVLAELPVADTAPASPAHATPAHATGAGAVDPSTGGRAPAPAAEREVAPALETASLAGTVLGPDGEPVPGAAVEAWLVSMWIEDYTRGGPDLAVLADERGRFLLEGLSGEFVISARTESLACRRGLCGELGPGAEAAELRLELVPAVPLRGRVVDASGAPVEGAELTVGDPYNGRARTEVEGVFSCPALRGFAVSDDQGRFAFEGLSEVNPRITVEREGYTIYRDVAEGPGRGRPKSARAAGGVKEIGIGGPAAGIDPERPVEIVLESGSVVAGRVFGSDGRPAVGARVERSSGDRTFPGVVATDERGRFVLRGVRSYGDAAPAIIVQHEGHAIEVVQPVALEPVARVGPEGRDEVIVNLRSELVAAGVVVDADGEPAAGLTLRIVGERLMDPGYSMGQKPTWEWAAERNQTVTDAAGAFRFDGLQPGPYRIETLRDFGAGADEPMSHEVRAGQTDLRLVLGETPGLVTIRGRVVDATTGAPLERFTVVPMIRVSADETSGYHWSFDGGTGEYALTGLDPAEIALTFQADGYSGHTLARERFEAGVHVRDARLAPRRSLQLSFSDEAGEAVARDVRVRVPGGGLAKLITAGDNLGGEVFSYGVAVPASGRRLEGLPAGPVTVELIGSEERFELDLSAPIEHRAHLVVGTVRQVELHLLVLTEGGIGDKPDLVEVWRELRGDPRDISGARPDLTRAEGLADVLDRRIDLLLVDADDRPLASVSVEPGELSFEVESIARSRSTEVLRPEFDGALPHAVLRLPAGPVRVHLLGTSDPDPEPVLELDLGAAEAERWEGLVLPAG